MHTNDTARQWNETSGWRMDAAARVLSDSYIDEIRKNLELLPPAHNADSANTTSDRLPY